MTQAQDDTALGGTLGALQGRRFHAVLFDNDGTLTDSTAAVERSWRRWATEHGVPKFSLEHYHGMPAAAIIAAVAPEIDPVAGLQRIVELEVADTEGVVALPGAAQALSVLGGHAAIVTSATADLAGVRVAAAGLIQPPVMITADDITRGKPDPQPYFLGAQGLGVDPSQCLVVEDAHSGLASGRAAGCATLGLATTHDAVELTADLVIADLSQIKFGIDEQGIRLSRR
ncbi:HAD-IA family hydrolase [Ornithinimicrobium sp. Arc0846-15]|nr:HAD-IA family hydrolase [Ornithinimicrobium laminariae]